MPHIELNHIWSVVNRSTYEFIKNSPFIKELAYCYEQTNAADGQIGWEGFYIRGKHTFIELFYPQERYKAVGLSGVGLGFDQHGNLKNCFKSFKEKFPKAEYQSFKRNGAAWFDYVAVNGSYYGNGHSLWIMEYSPEYFSENQNDVSREHYNKAAYDPEKLLQDITGLSIALSSQDQEILSSYLIQSGFKKSLGKIFTNSSGINIQILDESSSQKGICQIKLILNRSQSTKQIIQLGDSILEIEGDKATWNFIQPSI